MARPLRIQYPGAWYHVMNRGGRGKQVFRDDIDRRCFLRLLGESTQMWNIEVYAYSLLDNHYHLLIQTPDANISRAMRHIDGVYTQRFNKHHDYDGQLFRGRYKSILVDKDSYLLEVMRYIHLQAVKAGLVADPIEHQWTSHGSYLIKNLRSPWLRTQKILNLFGKERREAVKRFDGFIKKRIPEKIEKFYSRQRLSPILGSKAFEKEIRNKFLTKEKINYEIPDSRKQKNNLSINLIARAVCREYGLNIGDIQRSVRGFNNEARNLAIYFCRKVGGYKLTEIGKYFNLKSYTAVSSVLERVRLRMARNKSLRENASRIMKRLNAPIGS